MSNNIAVLIAVSLTSLWVAFYLVKFSLLGILWHIRKGNKNE